MEIVKRIFTFIFALFMAVFLLLATAVLGGLVPWHMVDELAAEHIGQLEPVAVSFGAFVWSVLVAMAALSGGGKADKRGGEIVVSDDGGAKVKVAQKVVVDVAEAAALSVDGVRGAKAKIQAAGGESRALDVAVDLTIDARHSASEIGDQVRTAVKSAVEMASSLNVERVEVAIAEIYKKPEN